MESFVLYNHFYHVSFFDDYDHYHLHCNKLTRILRYFWHISFQGKTIQLDLLLAIQVTIHSKHSLKLVQLLLKVCSLMEMQLMYIHSHILGLFEDKHKGLINFWKMSNLICSTHIYLIVKLLKTLCDYSQYRYFSGINYRNQICSMIL